VNGQERPTPARASSRQEQAEGQLRSLELFGMRFGLDRMRRMMTALGSPERSFEAVHVLGTNGKSSTTRMTAAILERHGLRTGAYLSPHLVSYCERVLVGEREMDPDGFADAVSRAAWAAERVNRTLAGDDHVTQFELLTAAAFWHLADAGVEVAAVEAGLGGRYDATSVLDAPVTVLTNVGLEHTRWLGPTVRHIAEEKLAAVAPGAVLVLGGDLDEQALAVARRVAAQREARLVRADPPAAGLRLGAAGEFQRSNFALARAAARAYLKHAGIPISEQAVAAAAAETEVPGRLQVVDEDPLTILDGAHNPHAVDSLLRSLPALVGERPLALVLGVLDDKDAAAMLAALLARARRAWFVAPPSPRALPPATLASLARQLGFGSAESGATLQALEEAQRWAREHGGAVLVTGSVYLVGEVLAQWVAR